MPTKSRLDCCSSFWLFLIPSLFSSYTHIYIYTSTHTHIYIYISPCLSLSLSLPLSISHSSMKFRFSSFSSPSILTCGCWSHQFPRGESFGHSCVAAAEEEDENCAVKAPQCRQLVGEWFFYFLDFYGVLMVARIFLKGFYGISMGFHKIS